MPRKKAQPQAQPSAEVEAPEVEAPEVEAPEVEAPLAEEELAEPPFAEQEDTAVDIEEPEPETEPVPQSSESLQAGDASRKHLRGLLEALVFASDKPLRAGEVAKLASAPARQVKEVLAELAEEYAGRGIQLAEVAGGWVFRTSAAYAPFVRDLTGQKPVRLSRAQLETLAIVAYRQPVTRPEVDDIRGVDCGPVLKTLLERDLVRILGKKDEPGRPILYGTSTGFLELFNLKSLKDLPTLREFTELNEESKRVAERELGESLEERIGGATDEAGGEAPATSEAESESDAESDAGAEAEAVALESDPPQTDQDLDPGARPTLESAEAPRPEVAQSYDPADEEMFPDDEDDEDDDEDEDDEEDDESAEDEDGDT